MEKTTNKYIYWILTVLIVAAALVIGHQYRKVNAMKISLENNYNRAFHELVDYVDDIDAYLQKNMLVSSPAQAASISSELFRETTAAKACLAQLPISEVQLEKTEKFLSQIGDYTYVLSQKAINGEEISDEDYNNLESLADYSAILKKELLSMQDEVYSGNISFGEIKRSADRHLSTAANAAGGDALSGFENVEKKFQEYPALIYDGPFSEHIEKINPVMTENAKTFSAEEALSKAKQFLGIWGENLQTDGESQNTPLESYLFKGSREEGTVYAAFVKKGAYPLYFLVSREIGEEQITVDSAISAARGYLSDKGFSSMKESYYDKSGGVATINFAYKQGNVVCYSDLVKVKVALDNGEIIGFESNGYLTNHRQRNFDNIKLTESEARAKINKNLSVDSVSLALIPKDNKTEVLCYEVKGTHRDKNFLIYINAENGREEDIMLLLESEDGILTV